MTEGSHRTNDIKDVIVSNSAIPDYRDEYHEEVKTDGFGNTHKTTYNNRKVTALTDFEDRIEYWLMFPRSKEAVIHEIFMTYAASTVWFRTSVALYDLQPILGIVPMVILGLLLSVICYQFVRNPPLISIGIWRLFFIILGTL